MGGNGLRWGRSACNAWWKSALKHPSAVLQSDGHYICHPLTQLAWTSTIGLPPTPASLSTQLGQHRFAKGQHSNSSPSLLPFPGPGVINSAARMMAAQIDWQQVRARALELEGGNHTDVAKIFLTEDDVWQVSPESLELVISTALLDRLVRVRPVVNPQHSLTARGETAAVGSLDHSKLYAVWKRAGLPFPESVISTHCGGVETPVRGGQGAPALLDPALVMSSRDLDPIIWPKAWHFSQELALLDSPEARAARFGHVPVKWVSAARRWKAGNRHRLIAARLNGLLCPVLQRS